MSTKRAPINVLPRSEQSGGEISVIESGSLPGFGGPPLHHHDFDEAFYVIEGKLTSQFGDELFSAKAGELAFAPRKVPHTYANLRAAPTRHLLVCTPAGFERYFARMAAERQGTVPPIGPCSRSPRTPRSIRESILRRFNDDDYGKDLCFP